MDNNTNNQKPSKKKIVIFGTGVGALSTAFELTDYPGWNELYDITIYQMGWRAGGKTASSRGINNRVQERGIHILQGWYWNMFRMLRGAYDERRDNKIDPSQKFQSWTDAVVKDDTTLLTTTKRNNEEEWESWPFIFPEDELIPGDASSMPTGVLLRRVAGVVCQILFGSPYKKRTGPLRFIPNWLFSKLMRSYPIAGEKVGEIPRPPYGKNPHENARQCRDFMGERVDDRSRLPVSRVLFVLMTMIIWPLFWLYTLLRIILSPLINLSTGLYRLFASFEWILVTAKGALQHCYSWKESQLLFGKVNDQDYRSFLRKAGGSEMMIRCGLVKFMYYGSFANLKGDKPGVLAADIAIRIVLDTILYRGSLVWKTKAGTGGTIIAPIYQVLQARGVTFRFFHRVSQIHYSDNGYIENVTLAQQVKLKNDTLDYQPLINVNQVADWPQGPLLDQLDPEWAEKVSASNVDLESMWADWQDYIPAKQLRKGIDFDEIVLAIPVNALKDICSEIIEKDQRWCQMVNQVPTVQTFGVQLWLSKSWSELGFVSQQWGLRDTDEPNSVNYANLLYSWTDMTRILQEENWPADNQPKDLAYFCGTMSNEPEVLPPYNDHGFPKTQYDRVFSFSKEWLDKYMGWFFPKGTPPGNPNGLDYKLLMDPENAGGKSGIELLQSQYFTANIDPTNRYTLAWPGTNQYRMKANDSGFRNLFLAGDWTDFGLNVGHLEGTCISGIRAAMAVLSEYAEK